MEARRDPVDGANVRKDDSALACGTRSEVNLLENEENLPESLKIHA